MSIRPLWAGRRGGAGAALLALGIAALCVPREPPAQRRPAQHDDSAAVATILAAARGANPLLCDLAASALDQRLQWGNPPFWGDFHPGDYWLRNPDPAVAASVRAAFRVLRDPGVIEPLRRALGDADACVRRLAAPLLGRTRHPQAVAALSAALRDTSPATRAAAVLGLGFAQSQPTVPQLIAALTDRAPAVRRLAAWALGEIANASAVPRLVQALGDAEPSVRATAAWALGQIEDPSAVLPLSQLLQHDGDVEVRKTAAWALGHLKS